MPIQPPVHLGVSRWRRLASALGLVLTLAAAPASAAADTCPAPTFAGLIASVGAGTVGSCLGAAYQDPSSQATMQPTSGGLLIASGVGDWTAFTDGTSTWVDGPSGV